MGQQTSKEELLYQQVSYGNVEGIKRLCEEGAGLEWVDREGKTPLMVACMNPDLFNVAKTLIELGANVNAYRRGFRAGTPLHHAAKRGLDQTVKLLLSHGANAKVMNDEFQTPLDVARAKGYLNVVRIIESHICIFSGWMRQLHGPGFLEALVPQWVTWKVWAAVVPRNSRDPNKAPKLELAIYPDQQAQKEEEVAREHEGGCRKQRRRRRRRRRREKQAALPCTIIKLWKASIEEPNFDEPDPSLVINEKTTKKRFKFLSANEGDKQQLDWFYNACRGMHQLNIPSPSIPATEPTSALPVTQYAMAFSDIDLAIEKKPPGLTTDSGSEVSDSDGSSNSDDKASQDDTEPGGQATSKNISSGRPGQPSSSGAYNSQQMPQVEPGRNPVPHNESELSSLCVSALIQHNDPSAPPAIECPDDGLIFYPTVDTSPIDLSVPTPEIGPATSKLKEDGDASACAICLDAPKEGACVPCGHVVGCMSCLNDIKDKGWGCPVCRTEVRQVLKLYTV